MIRRITEHNRLNGVVFAASEFVLVAAAAALIGIAFIRQGNTFVGVLVFGIALNSLVVAGFAFAQLLRGERGESMLKLFNPEYRGRVAREHPNLSTDTLAITATTLVPFCLLLLVVAGAARRQDER